MVLIDAPPLSGSAEGLTVAGSADQTILVVRLGSVTHQAATLWDVTLKSAGVSVLGVVANDVRPGETSLG